MTFPIDLSTRECYLGDGGEHGLQSTRVVGSQARSLQISIGDGGEHGFKHNGGIMSTWEQTSSKLAN